MTDTPQTPDLTVIPGDKETAKERKKREVKEFVEGAEERKKTPKTQIYRSIAAFMDWKQTADRLEQKGLQFSCEPKVVKSGTGYLLGRRGPGKTLVAMDQDELEGIIFKWLAEEAVNVFDFRTLSIQDLPSIVKAWIALTDKIDEEDCDIIGEYVDCDSRIPESVRWAWNRVKWPRRYGVTKEEFPLISEVLSRMDCPDQFCAWVGSIFDKESPQSQYMWLYGEGGNGKSAMVNLIGSMCGTAHTSARKPNARDMKFWSTCLIGKRFVSFGDTNSFKFPSEDIFKMLTGDKYIPLEEKWGRLMHVKLPCKYIFTSNMRPEISDSMADRRRVIFSKIEPINCEPDGKYEERLIKESEPFLNYCREMYDKLNVNGFIKMNEEVVDTLVSTTEGNFQETFDRSLELDTREVVKQSDRWMISDGELTAFLGRGRATGCCGMNKHTREKFKNWLRKRVDNKKVRIGDVTVRRWVGIRFKPGSPEDVAPFSGVYDD